MLLSDEVWIPRIFSISIVELLSGFLVFIIFIYWRIKIKNVHLKIVLILRNKNDEKSKFDLEEVEKKLDEMCEESNYQKIKGRNL